MAFEMDVSDLLDEFGTDIKVWQNSDRPVQAYPGAPTDYLDTSNEAAEKRHEPVLPLSSNSALGRQILAGGGELQGKLVWYSKGRFKTGSRVYVPSQMGYYKVTSFSTYEPYSDFYEYVLESDDHHGITE